MATQRDLDVADVPGRPKLETCSLSQNLNSSDGKSDMCLYFRSRQILGHRKCGLKGMFHFDEQM